MRVANVSGRATLIVGGHGGAGDGGIGGISGIDVATGSGGRFDADPASLYPRWNEFVDWATGVDPSAGRPVEPAGLQAPSPAPRQVFAVGLNYAPHAAEAGLAIPDAPVVFTKFASCITGPFDEIPLPSGHVDWEVELVAVVGRRAEFLEPADAWAHLAGVTLGQDFSERVVQAVGPAPQFSLGKSFPRFGPVGPVLVTPDEFDDPDDIGLACLVNGEVVQQGRTRDLIFSIPELVARISAICPLLPGDLIFTGTPAGTGAGRTPPRYLAVGDEVVSTAEVVGSMRHRCGPPLRTRSTRTAG